jgi:hypothetical protein
MKRGTVRARPRIRWRGLCLLALLGLLLLATGSGAAEVRGRVTLASGQPVANEAIVVERKEVGRTDVAGVYLVNLPPGDHTLVIKGQSVPVWVSPQGSRHDIRLK